MTALTDSPAPTDALGRPRLPRRRVVTPTVLQLEAAECGAAALGIVLAHYGRAVPLAELRQECGVSRDGSKASSLVRAARKYGLETRARRLEPADLGAIELPAVIHWQFNHFVVLEGFRDNRVYLNDPAWGPRTVDWFEFDRSFTGVALTFRPGPGFEPGGRRPGLAARVGDRLRGSWDALFYVLLTCLGLLIPGLAAPAFARVFVDEVLVRGQADWFRPLILGLFLAVGLRFLLVWLQEQVLLRLQDKLSKVQAGRFLWHVLRLPLGFFNQRYGGEIGGRMGLNDHVCGLICGQLVPTLLNLILVVVYGAVMLWYDPFLALIAAISGGIGFGVLGLLFQSRRNANLRLVQDHGKLLGATMGGLQIIETVKATASEDAVFARWAGLQARVLAGEQELGRSAQYMTVIPSALTGLTGVAVLGLGGLRVIEGSLTIGMLVAFLCLLSSFLAPMAQLIALGPRLQDLECSLDRLDDVLENPLDPEWAQVKARPAAAEAADASASAASSILTGLLELRSVTFGYNPQEAPLLTDFNLTLKPGARVALVGASGSGKSTVSRLATGLYRPWSGQILLDGRPRAEWSRDALGAGMALVDQEILLFAGSVRDNLTLWDRTISEAAVFSAARDADIHDLILSRPGGYDSPVVEGGANFSGGQRQRLELARALVSDPVLLVLDEATSALDPVSEQRIDENLRRRGCACLIIAHRLSTIRDADEILVLDQGRVVERGRHEELLAGGGWYARLIAAD